MDKLTLLLKAQGRFADLIQVTNDFFMLYPEALHQGVAERILQRSVTAERKLLKR